MSTGCGAVRRFGWLPLAVFLAHEVCAHVVDGYRLWPPVDIPMHFMGGLAIAYFVSGSLRVFAGSGLIRMPDRAVHLLLVFGLTCAAAVFWEFAEWTADHTLGTRCQLGIDDTLGDLLMGIAGAAVFLTPLAFRSGTKEAAGKASNVVGAEAAPSQEN